MGGVLVGFAIIIVVIVAGYIVGRLDLVGEHAPYVISRLVFFVLNPCLVLTLLADSNVHRLFSTLFVVTSVAAVLVFAIYVGIAKVVLKRATPEALLGGTAASYENAGNIGLPVATYVLGNAAFSVPVMLFQLIIFQPILLAVLDVTTTGGTSAKRILLRPLTNPVTIASAIGIVLAVTQVPVPDAVLQPFRIIGGAAVPLVLIAFGISLRGQKPMQPGTGRRDIVLATVLKLAAMPLLAFLLARFVFAMSGAELFATVLLAGLPSAQNVLVFAQRYGRGFVVVRDTILLTTIGSVPVLVIVAALLSP